MEKFKIANSDREYETVEGERLNINDVECFIFKDDWGYNISHVATGMIMASNLIHKGKAIQKVKNNMKKCPNWLSDGIKKLKGYGFDYPVNK